jgi:hypothetical protein
MILANIEGPAITTNSAATSFDRRKALLPIVAGGLSAGIIDLAQALILFGTRVPLGIAAGLLGRQAAHVGGVSMYALGDFLHFFIAFSAATVYYVAGRKLEFLKEHWLICGPLYGAAVDQVMALIVLPLSALHAWGPYKWHDVTLGIVVHTVGLPISFSVWRFAK